jgi:hypothetical protein
MLRSMQVLIGQIGLRTSLRLEAHHSLSHSSVIIDDPEHI